MSTAMLVLFSIILLGRCRSPKSADYDFPTLVSQLTLNCHRRAVGLKQSPVSRLIKLILIIAQAKLEMWLTSSPRRPKKDTEPMAM